MLLRLNTFAKSSDCEAPGTQPSRPARPDRKCSVNLKKKEVVLFRAYTLPMPPTLKKYIRAEIRAFDTDTWRRCAGIQRIRSDENEW